MQQVLALTVGVVILLVLFSLDAVEQNEYGLMYNWVTKTLHKDVYHGGTHFVGFWNKFIVFPATVQTIEFSDRPGMSHAPMLHTRTKEGLGLHLSISFQYKLNQSRLSELFAITNTNYEGLFRRIARDQLLEAASEYEGPQYWLERHRIGDHMRRLVDEQLRQSCAMLWGLQLQVIDLPNRYEQSITMTQVQQQMIKTRRNEQIAASIRADTEVLRAEFARQVQVVQADAMANFTLDTKVAEAVAAERKIDAEAEALGYVRQKLGLSPAEAVRYEQLSAYGGLSNATFLAGVPGLAKAGLAVATASAVVPTSFMQSLSGMQPAAAPRAPPATPVSTMAVAQEGDQSAEEQQETSQGDTDDASASRRRPALRARRHTQGPSRQQMMSLFEAPGAPAATDE